MEATLEPRFCKAPHPDNPAQNTSSPTITARRCGKRLPEKTPFYCNHDCRRAARNERRRTSHQIRERNRNHQRKFKARDPVAYHITQGFYRGMRKLLRLRSLQHQICPHIPDRGVYLSLAAMFRSNPIASILAMSCLAWPCCKECTSKYALELARQAMVFRSENWRPKPKDSWILEAQEVSELKALIHWGIPQFEIEKGLGKPRGYAQRIHAKPEKPVPVKGLSSLARCSKRFVNLRNRRH